jgi:hypothetical protein
LDFLYKKAGTLLNHLKFEKSKYGTTNERELDQKIAH